MYIKLFFSLILTLNMLLLACYSIDDEASDVNQTLTATIKSARTQPISTISPHPTFEPIVPATNTVHPTSTSHPVTPSPIVEKKPVKHSQEQKTKSSVQPATPTSLPISPTPNNPKLASSNISPVNPSPVSSKESVLIPSYMINSWLCTDGDSPDVDDLTTTEIEKAKCSLKVEYTDKFALVTSNGIPNHDFESTLGCCAQEQEYAWKIPLYPEAAETVIQAPDRGPVAISVNGVPFFGPEDGPGGDAVASHHGYYVEDRQAVILGVCGGHSGPGGTFHYHYDANCVHWHPEKVNRNWIDWIMDFLNPNILSPVIGFSFDGYPIYGPYGNNSSGELAEMRSSYRLKTGKTGYGGIDDWEYVQGLGDLDECNGITSTIPDTSEKMYHYHASKISGDDGIGFPYFILCYHGVPEESNFLQGSGQNMEQGRQVRPPQPGTRPQPPRGQPRPRPQ